MALQPITLKIVRSLDGEPKGIELWQGDQHITVTTEAHGSVPFGYRWVEVRDAVESAVTHIHKEAIDNLNSRYHDLLTPTAE